MHQQSLDSMHEFFKLYLEPEKDKNIIILDVGSKSYNNSPTYKPFIIYPNWEYKGMDLEFGKNVDIVMESSKNWPIKSESIDFVISGQCIEHVLDLYRWFEELGRVLKFGGICCIIAPSIFPEHKYPKDYWRIMPDGMEFLFTEISKLQLINTKIKSWGNFSDCIGIAKK